MKYLKGKLWQIGFIITKIVKDVYYGIKWFLAISPSFAVFIYLQYKKKKKTISNRVT